MKNFKIFDLFFRYLILLVLSIGNLYLIYLIFTPITTYLVYSFLKIFYPIILSNNTLTYGNKIIEIIPACVAGSAIYFLFILNLTTSLTKKQRVYSLIYSLSLFITFNILRIIILSILFINSVYSFEILHTFFWYFLSTFFVVFIWFSGVKIFKIKQIPIYSDIKFLIKQIKPAEK
jgi:exosortase/archaeosortase family protein